jgi:hypothetical protein
MAHVQQPCVLFLTLIYLFLQEMAVKDALRSSDLLESMFAWLIRSDHVHI